MVYGTWYHRRPVLHHSLWRNWKSPLVLLYSSHSLWHPFVSSPWTSFDPLTTFYDLFLHYTIGTVPWSVLPLSIVLLTIKLLRLPFWRLQDIPSGSELIPLSSSWSVLHLSCYITNQPPIPPFSSDLRSDPLVHQQGTTVAFVLSLSKSPHSSLPLLLKPKNWHNYNYM